MMHGRKNIKNKSVTFWEANTSKRKGCRISRTSEFCYRFQLFICVILHFRCAYDDG